MRLAMRARGGFVFITALSLHYRGGDDKVNQDGQEFLNHRGQRSAAEGRVYLESIELNRPEF